MEIPGYTIEKQIGKGGMASVFLARHQGLDRQVALKIMSHELNNEDSSFSERFIREARIVASLNHQHIVTVYDVGKHNSHHYISMEYLAAGITLGDKIKQGLDIGEGLNTIKQMAQALGFAHSKGIVHRDVKPDNIMYRDDGSAVLTDFGIARAAVSETKMTATGTIIGSPHYMSPEQAQAHDVGTFSDIYSLGVVFYEVLTGKVPYQGDSSIAVVLKHITEPVPTLPDELKKYQVVLNKMMAKRPEQRYQSCEQIVVDLNKVIDDGFITDATVVVKTSSDETSSERTVLWNTDEKEVGPSQRKQYKKTIASIVAGTVIVIVATGVYLYGKQTTGQQQQIVQQQLTVEKLKQAQIEEKRKLAEREEKRKQTQRVAEQRQQQKIRQQQEKKQQEKQQLDLQRKQQAEAQAAIRAEKIKAERIKAERIKKEKAEKQQAAQKKQRIKSLLITAEQQLFNNQLAASYKTYKQVLRQEPRNKRAKKGVMRVADRHLTLASEAATAYNFEKAKAHISSVIKIAPEHRNLKKTQDNFFKLKKQHKESRRLAEDAAKKREQASTEKITEEKPAQQTKRRAYGGF